MIAIFLAPFYILLHIGISIALLRWLDACPHLFQRRGVRAGILAVYWFLVLSIALAFLWPVRWLAALANLWFGAMIYLILSVSIVLLAGFLLRRLGRFPKDPGTARRITAASGCLCLALTLGLSAYGYMNARNIQVTPYSVTVEKDCGSLQNLRIVLAADFHLGYNMGYGEMKNLVEKINEQNPDLVVIAGDFFDNNFDAVERPEATANVLRGIKSRYGVYACYGNHDIQEKILAGFTFNHKEKKESDPRMDAFLEASGIRLLRDESVLIDDAFYLAGRADRERPGRGIDKRLTPEELTEGLDQTKPILVMDHEPDELEELARAGVDLDLCGHTHDGQTFPGNLTIGLFWENACGYLEKDGMHNIVTSGVGVFGPNMRVGTKSEICVIDCEFK